MSSKYGKRPYQAVKNMPLAKLKKTMAPPGGRKSYPSGKYIKTDGRNELKFLDTALSFSIDRTLEIPATGQLSLIPQGAGDSARTGRKCIIKSIEIHLVANLQSASVSADSAAIYVVVDHQANLGAAAVSAVFTSTDGPIALRNLANSSRFTILKAWRCDFKAGAGVAAAYGNDSQSFTYYTTCNIPMEFDDTIATTGAITTITSNNIFLLAGSYQADDAISVGGNCRIRFTDN